MQELDLPLFPKDMSLDDVLGRLHDVHRAGAVFFTGERFSLASARDIAVARARNVPALEGLQPCPAAQINPAGMLWLDQPYASVQTLPFGNKQFRVNAPGRSGPEHVAAFLNQKGFGAQVWEQCVRRGLGGLLLRDAQLLPPGRIEHKIILDDVMTGRYDHPRIDVMVPDGGVGLVFAHAPRDFYCDGLPSHDDFDNFQPPPLRKGDACPYLDGATIVSST